MEHNRKGKSTRRRFLERMLTTAASMTAVGPLFLSGTANGKGRAPFQQADKNGVFIIYRGGHSAKEIARARAEILPVNYIPPSDRWQHIPLTVAALRQGKPLKVVMLGDSIVNDTHRSDWSDLLQAHYPDSEITVVAVVRGSTGCWWYKDEERVKQYVIPLKPDLLIVGGISHKNDVDSIRDVIRQVQELHPCDVLLMTGAFGSNNPKVDLYWSFDIPLNQDNYRRNLYALSNEMHTGFLDMTAHWGRYMKDSPNPIEWFKRDDIHANIRGEQVLGAIMANHFEPPLPRV